MLLYHLTNVLTPFIEYFKWMYEVTDCLVCQVSVYDTGQYKYKTQNHIENIIDQTVSPTFYDFNHLSWSFFPCQFHARIFILLISFPLFFVISGHAPDHLKFCLSGKVNTCQWRSVTLLRLNQWNVFTVYWDMFFAILWWIYSDECSEEI